MVPEKMNHNARARTGEQWERHETASGGTTRACALRDSRRALFDAPHLAVRGTRWFHFLCQARAPPCKKGVCHFSIVRLRYGRREIQGTRLSIPGQMPLLQYQVESKR